MNPSRWSGRFHVVNTFDGSSLESHATREAAERAARWVNEHETAWKARRDAGDKHAAQADRPGRPFHYEVKEQQQ